MRLRLNLFYAISFLILFQGVFSRINLDFFSKLLSEILILFWFFLELRNKRFKSINTSISLGFIYLIWVGLAAIYSNDNLYEYYLYTRYFIFAILFIYISYNAYDLKKFASFFIKSINLIVLIQIFATIILLLFEGRLERNVGTMSSTGGSLATVWPLTFTPYFFFRYVVNGKWKDLLIIGGLVLIGYASGKRAVYFLIPISILIFYLGFIGNKIFVFRIRNKIRLLSIGFFLFFILLLGISRTQSLAQGQGFSIDSLSNAIGYVGEYSTMESYDGQSTGRLSTTQKAIQGIWSDTDIFFGKGLTTFKGEITYSGYNIGYGITGFIRELISIGLPGSIIFILFYLKILFGLRKLKRLFLHDFFNNDFFWAWMFSISGLISLLITNISYSRVFSQSLNPLIFIFISLGITYGVINHVNKR